MKHLFLPLPIETVRAAWDEWRSTNDGATEEVRLVEASGGCFIVTSTGRPPRVFVELLKTFLSQGSHRLARAS